MHGTTMKSKRNVVSETVPVSLYPNKTHTVCLWLHQSIGLQQVKQLQTNCLSYGTPTYRGQFKRQMYLKNVTYNIILETCDSPNVPRNQWNT
jgi:hypothetical protein